MDLIIARHISAHFSQFPTQRFKFKHPTTTTFIHYMSDNEKARSKLKRLTEKDEGTDRDGERSSKKRHKHARNEESSSHRSKRHRDKSRERDKASSSKSKSKSRVKIIDDDPDEGMWVEKNIDMDGENVRFTFLPDFLLYMLK